MVSTEFSNSLLKTKFRGCLIGALIGDCLGIPFEFEGYYKLNDTVKIILPTQKRLSKFMNDLMNEEPKKAFHYSDDTAMTVNVASSIVDKGEINAKDMAEKFVTAYFTEDRGYGRHVRLVFHKLKESEFTDVFLPAKEQFDGEGSFGNGAAMRSAPIALFGNNKGEQYIMNAAKECALVTHAHVNGYNGAILQCLAVNTALGLDPSQELDPVNFVDSLLEKMEQIETEHVKPYSESLKKMKDFFLQDRDVSPEEISQSLGNGHDVSALMSVPTAIYSFLRGIKPLKDYLEISNPFMRTILIAVSVGGDTDTIASMAGAIAGVYYGEEGIPEVVKKKCEAVDDIISLADKLFDVTYKNK